MIVFQWIVLIVALAPFAYYALGIYCAWDYFRGLREKPEPERSFVPPASILKPVRGVDREAYENFASFCRQDYPEYEVIFAVEDRNDSIIPVIQRLQREFPKQQIRVLLDTPSVGTNRKINKLCDLAKSAKYDLLVMSDSDVRVDSDYLREMAAPFARPDVGAVTAFFRGVAESGLFSELDALGVPAESAAGALVARKMEGQMKFAFGWSMATTKRHLREIGGFEAMADHHSDDFELGNRIAGAGYKVEFMRKYVWMVFPNEGMEEFFQHELRWAIGLRNVRPAGYLGLALTYGLPWTILACLVAPSEAIAVTYACSYVLLRLGLAWTVGVWGIGDPVTRRSIWLVPLRDLINFGVWVVGFFSSTIHWRGFAFRVQQGLLIPLESVRNSHGSGT
jgi:ceramide glucosyltransferase